MWEDKSLMRSQIPAGTKEHRHKAEELAPLRCGVITVSDSRTVQTDESGALLKQLLVQSGHLIKHYALLPNNQQQVTTLVEQLLDADLDVLILTGGTGLGQRDRTVEAIRDLLDKELPGFGELFRLLSFQEQIGSAAILSRAICGVAKGRLLVSLPGSKAAVELAMTRILLPELRHILWELRR